jgi:2-keto-4-pentenoate hydratase
LVSSDTSERTSPAEIAKAFVSARLEARALPDYPGEVPATLAEGYAVQDAAIDLWPDELVGWKVGLIPPQYRERLGADRLAGCIFAKSVSDATDAPTPFPAIEGGFTAVEAEYVVRVGKDAPAGKTEWTAEEAADYVGELMIGIEIAGSPLSTINALGPTVVVSDFGNNAAQILGPVIDNWRDGDWASMTAETFIDGKSVGKGGAASIPGSPLAAFAYLLGHAASRGRPLKTGQLVTTGASTGIHDIVAGQTSRIDFGAQGEMSCVAVPAK